MSKLIGLALLACVAITGCQAMRQDSTDAPAPYEPSLIADPEAKKAVFDDLRLSFGRIGTEAKNGDAAKAARLLLEWANNTGPGSFDGESAAYRLMALDNARTVPFFLTRKQLPDVTCEGLARLTPPVLIINGANTRQFYSLSGEAIARCIPGSQRVVIANTTHGASGRQPAAFNEAVLGFLAKH
jgi:pimeloyl-ACP methyl ester carboxylesterase